MSFLGVVPFHGGDLNATSYGHSYKRWTSWWSWGDMPTSWKHFQSNSRNDQRVHGKCYFLLPLLSNLDFCSYPNTKSNLPSVCPCKSYTRTWPAYMIKEMRRNLLWSAPAVITRVLLSVECHDWCCRGHQWLIFWMIMKWLVESLKIV